MTMPSLAPLIRKRIAKHNHVRDAIFAAASQAALGPRNGPAGLLPGSNERPADVLLPFLANGKDAALDISVVNPLQQELVRKVARDGDSGVQHSFNIKMGKYSDRCEAEGIEFIPLIVDTFGGWHKESLEVVSKLGRQVSRQTGKEEEEIVRQLRQRVAILLVRNAPISKKCSFFEHCSNGGGGSTHVQKLCRKLSCVLEVI